MQLYDNKSTNLLYESKSIQNGFKGKKLSLKAVIGIVLLTFFAGTLAYLYTNSKLPANLFGGNTTLNNSTEIEDLITTVSKLVELPQNETPTIATISDKDKLRANPFFARAQNGDQILIYAAAGRAYLYRPSTNKIVDIAPITVQGQQAPAAQSEADPVLQTTPSIP